MTPCEVCGASASVRRLLDDESLRVCSTCGHAVRLEGHGAARPHPDGGTPPRDDLRLRLTYRRIRRAVAGHDVRKVYEVGYGSGSLLRRFLDDGADVAGCDPGMLEADVDEVVLRRGALTTSPLGPGMSADADLVVAVHVVEHLPSAIPSLTDLLSLARPGGLVVLVTPTLDCWGARAFGADWWMLEDPTHERFYSDRSLRQALRLAGATDVSVTRPVLDSLGVDGASLARRWGGDGRDGALGDRRGRLVSAAVMPLSVMARTLVPRTRPVLDAVARRP